MNTQKNHTNFIRLGSRFSFSHISWRRQFSIFYMWIEFHKFFDEYQYECKWRQTLNNRTQFNIIVLKLNDKVAPAATSSYYVCVYIGWTNKRKKDARYLLYSSFYKKTFYAIVFYLLFCWFDSIQLNRFTFQFLSFNLSRLSFALTKTENKWQFICTVRFVILVSGFNECWIEYRMAITRFEFEWSSKVYLPHQELTILHLNLHN